MSKEKQGCFWCKQFTGVPLRGFTEHGCQSIVVKFCPNCGKQLADNSFTAFAYEDDGMTTEDLATYDNAEEAIEFAESHNWDEMVVILSTQT